jgi:hypothetical protein
MVGRAEGVSHPCRDGAGDHERVGVAGGSDDVEAEALEVVERVGGRVQLVLAAVAGAGVDVAEGQRARTLRRADGEVAPDALQAVEEDEHRANGPRRRSRARSSC